MKQNLFFLRAWVFSFMLVTLSSISYSMNDGNQAIALSGNWNVSEEGVERTLFPLFSAYHDGNTVTIYNDKPVCDLTIIITNQETCAEVYCMEVCAANSGCVVIPVTDLGDGNYCLTISNPEAGYVYGYFKL